jgi:acyl dehydratase
VLIIDGPDQLKARAGEELGVTDWITISQDEVDAFADLTHDHQWIHVDRERAAASPFGGTIAHGYLTLALVPRMQTLLFEIRGFSFGLNYGLNRVRFPAPMPVGAALRMTAVLSAVNEVGGNLEYLVTNTFEREGGDKPVCVAESIFRVYL